MQIPLAYAEAIIGAAGNNINFLRKTSGAAVTVTESVSSGGQLEMTVEVRGSAPQVHTAQQLIEVSRWPWRATVHCGDLALGCAWRRKEMRRDTVLSRQMKMTLSV